MNIFHSQLPALWERIWNTKFFLFFHIALKLKWPPISCLAQMSQIYNLKKWDKKVKEKGFPGGAQMVKNLSTVQES